MPHGGPDWGTAGPLSTVYTLEDMAELAARLGSIVTFDRRGNVIFLENFDGSLAKVYPGTGGVGGSIAISNERARHGNFSCKMVTGNTIGDYAYVDAVVSYPVLSKMGLEICLSLPLTANIQDFIVYLGMYEGLTWWDAAVLWDVDSDRWQYWNGSDYVPLSPPYYYYWGEVPFYHIKLVVDFVNKKFVRLIADHQVYDLEGIAVPSSGVAYPPCVCGGIDISTRVNDVCTAYLDSMIITQNEP